MRPVVTPPPWGGPVRRYGRPSPSSNSGRMSYSTDRWSGPVERAHHRSIPNEQSHRAGDPLDRQGERSSCTMSRRVVIAEDEAIIRLDLKAVSYTHLRAHETVLDLVCRL